MIVRARIENLSLEEIYGDYCTIKAMAEKYYSSGTEKIKSASDALMDVLKNEIQKRTLKELENKRNTKDIRESIYSSSKMSATMDFVNELKNYKADDLPYGPQV